MLIPSGCAACLDPPFLLPSVHLRGRLAAPVSWLGQGWWRLVLVWVAPRVELFVHPPGGWTLPQVLALGRPAGAVRRVIFPMSLIGSPFDANVVGIEAGGAGSIPSRESAMAAKSSRSSKFSDGIGSCGSYPVTNGS